MRDIRKYQNVIPAFYACYDKHGEVSTDGVRALTRHLISKGIKGVYVAHQVNASTSMWMREKKCWKLLWMKQKGN